MSARDPLNRIPQPAPDDRLAPPPGLDRWAVLRALDRERLAAEAPDVPAARLARIVKIRDEIRRGVYLTDDRLATAAALALRALRDPRRR
jgi:hypothetical protein